MKIRVESRTNNKLKELIKSKDEFYVFEGEKLVKDILKKKIRISKFITLRKNEGSFNDFIEYIDEFWVVSESVMRKISDLKEASDFIIFIKIKKNKINFSLAQTVLVLDNIQDPANTGTVFRCASAFGISNIAFTGNCVKPNNRKFLRGSQGSILDINHQSFPDLKSLLKKTEKRGFNIYLTSSKDSPRSIDAERVNFPCLIIIGNEGKGLPSELFLKHFSIKIPQRNTMESLNAGVSACIIMYEIKKLI